MKNWYFLRNVKVKCEVVNMFLKKGVFAHVAKCRMVTLLPIEKKRKEKVIRKSKQQTKHKGGNQVFLCVQEKGRGKKE